MKIVESFPHAVREIENCWIPLPDGQRLAARIWLPADAAANPVPAIIEYIPYRKRDGTRWRDEPMHRYFAGHGYAAVRIDLRGSGDSDGLLLDEYLEQEQQDGVDAIHWVASQPWCNGRVGMMGKSWGGFNSLQIAARQPPELHAIITVCSTDDRYADDAHYMGGCLLNENLAWGANFFTLAALPPDPEIVGESWRTMWRERLESLQPFAARWLQHPTRDEYWKHGSVCEVFARIRCPVYAIGGWSDAYSNAIPRLLAGLNVPRKGLVGPWGHLYPHNGRPGPAIGFLQEAVRWWDHWLRDIDTGVMDEPMYRFWMQHGDDRSPNTAHLPGRWAAEWDWPSQRIQPRVLALDESGLVPFDQRSVKHDAPTIQFTSLQLVGLAAGGWCHFGEPAQMPADQHNDDAKSLTFDSRELSDRLEILGAPEVQLRLSVDRPLAWLCCRLCDVAPNGVSTRITYGLLNLTHRNGHETIEPLTPGEQYAVRVKLNDAAYSMPPGHKIRLAISTNYWPLVWPSPEPVTVWLTPCDCRLTLPVRPAREEDSQLRPFEPPASASPLKSTDWDEEEFHRTIERDEAKRETIYVATLNVTDSGQPAMSHIEAIDLAAGHAITERFTIRDDDPLSARTDVRHHARLQRREWLIEVETHTQFWSTVDQFHLQAELRASENGRGVFEKQWRETIQRRGV